MNDYQLSDLSTSDLSQFFPSDYDTFLADDFDANDYASSILQDSEDAATDVADIGMELSKLAFSIDIVNKQIQEHVIANYDTLVKQVTGIKELEDELNTVETNIMDLKNSLQSLSYKIKEPYKQLVTFATQLSNLQITCELLRKIHRFVVLKKRLEAQLSSKSNTGDRDIITAALTLSKLSNVMEETDFEGIDIVSCELDFIKQSRKHVEEEAATLLKEGIETQNQTKMAIGLQVFYNMKQMSAHIEAIVHRMLDSLLQNIKKVVDLQSIQNEARSASRGDNAASPSVGRKSVNEPVTGGGLNHKQLAAALWKRMELLMKTMSDECIKVYSLEKVLELKKDPMTHISFLEEISKTLDATSLVNYFWRILSQNFERELKNATRSSSFLQNIFVDDYPKLLKLLQEFFSRVALHNGTLLTDYSQTPEYVIMLRSFSTFQNSFLAKSLQRMQESVNSAFSTFGGLTRSPPDKSHMLNIIRIIGSELETSSFEPNLVQTVAKNSVKSITLFCNKCEKRIPTNQQSIYTANPSNSSVINFLNMHLEIVNSLYYMHQSIWKILEEYPDKIISIMKPGADNCHDLMMKIGNKLIELIKKDSTSIIMKIHQENFAKLSGTSDSSSNYIKELTKHVRYYHSTIIQNFSCGAQPKVWVKQISKHILITFISEATKLTSSLKDSGKLKLSEDMAELEFTISQFLSEYGSRIEEVGDEYKALRADLFNKIFDTSSQ
ncbi:Golgi transport complex subunit 5-domain-containing protein [Mycotypha africana]|uniref:Golgi transport complex subunit 5-domain-containing protein n=1 Tax=Mycotypha africana TaxID=64632 RepID=UPI0023001609|nr:Golgi transport complex subunit 5-domain-containing protein [Mycotypha africana]KAI8970068.1 Golgi transport complex subunit 5-domain-containing protein [Mycotypha africana]